MLKLPADILQAGMVLARPVTDSLGRTLLKQGMALTDEYISVLLQRGVSAAHVVTAEEELLRPDNPLPNDTRQQAQVAINQVFNFVRQLVITADEPAEKVAENSDVAEELQQSPEFDRLETTVNSMLTELFTPKTLFGLNQIKTHNQLQFGHAVNVAVVAMLIGINLHLSVDDLARLGMGSLLHDIGKIFFAPELTQLNGHINNRLKLREHTRLGYELLRSRNPDAVMVNHVALQHHERQDGLGYPRGLRSTNTIERTRFGRDNISLIAEITAVADVFDILSNGGAQNAPLTPPQIAATMRRLGGTFLNREIVTIFLALLPVFPAGLNVVARAGRYANYKGVVLEPNSKQPDRPTIRLMFNPQGVRISPIDLNLATRDNISIEAML